MNIKKATLAAAVSAAVGLGTAGQALAGVYGGSRLLIQDLSISVEDSDGNPIAAEGFNFNLTNTASLNGVAVIDISNCTGNFAIGGSTGNCGGGGSGALPVLGGTGDTATSASSGPNVAEVPAGSRGGEDNYSFIGPGANEYGTADSVIDDAELTNDAATATRQIAESELQTGTDASGSAEIQSTTGFTFTFNVGTTANVTLDFEADPDLLAEISDALAAAATAQANVSAQFRLSRSSETGGGFVQWDPQGTAANDCLTAGLGATCSESADGEDLNNQVSVNAVPNSTDSFSRGNGIFSSFGLSVTDLPQGSYSFSLQAVTSSSVTRNAVPEPGTLLLLGSGFAALGIGARRRKRFAG